MRARIYADLLPSLYAKCKAMDVSGPNGGAIRIDHEQMHEQVMRKLLTGTELLEEGHATGA